MSKRNNVVGSLSSDSSDSEEEWTASGSVKKVAPKRARVQIESEPEEGEVSSEGEEIEDLPDGLDGDLVGDDDDKRQLAKMSEKEREEELFKRAERRDAMMARQAVKKKLKERKEKERAEKDKADKTSSSTKKPTAADIFGSDSDSNGSSVTNVRLPTDRRMALEKKKEEQSGQFKELIARRKQLKQKTIVKTSEVFSDDDEDKRGSSSSSSSASSSRSSSPAKRKDRTSMARRASLSSSSSASDRGRSSSSGSEDGRRSDDERFIENKEDLNKIRLSRSKLGCWVHYPFFKEVVTGCFVKVSIGQNEGIGFYRCAEIIDVMETAKVYDLDKTRTNKGLRLRIGDNQQVFRLCFISNADFTDAEFESWKRRTLASGMDLPRMSFVEDKVGRIKSADNYKVEDDVTLEQIIASKRRFAKAPHNFAMRKAELMKLRDLAYMEQETEQGRRYESELQDIESQAERIDRRRSAKVKSITSINERNRKMNQVQAEEASKREAAETKALESTGGDPFSRIYSVPVMIMGSRKQNEKSKMQTEKNKADVAVKPKPVTVPMSSVTKTLEKTAPKIPVNQSLQDIHDFDVDIDLDDVQSAAGGQSVVDTSRTVTALVSSQVTAPIGVPVTQGPVTGVAPRRSLNLAEYKKKRGLL